MIKITHIPQDVYCHIQRTTASAKVYRSSAYEWEGQAHKFYDVTLRDDYSIICQDKGFLL